MDYGISETTLNDLGEMITHYNLLSLEQQDLLINFMDVISDRSLQKVEEEAGDIISSASPEEILFCDNIYNRVEKTDFDPETHEMLHVLAATICNRMLDPTMPLNHWLLGAITAAAQAGYVAGQAEQKGAH